MNKGNTSIWAILVVIIAAIIVFTVVLPSAKEKRAATEEQDMMETEGDMMNEEGEDDMEDIVLSDNAVEIDTESSVVAWRGQKTLVVNWVDEGTLRVDNGALEITEDGMIEGGYVVVDMTSLEVTQTGSGDRFDGLAGHLSSADFFDVENYPTSMFVITSVTTPDAEMPEMVEVTGDMTIKGNTQEITFPANVTTVDGVTTVSANVELDRTEFDVRFGSGKFFDNLGDNIIDDMFTLDVTLVTN